MSQLVQCPADLDGLASQQVLLPPESATLARECHAGFAALVECYKRDYKCSIQEAVAKVEAGAAAVANHALHGRPDQVSWFDLDQLAAQFLAIRNDLAMEWQPRTGVERQLTDAMAQAQTMVFRWTQILATRMSLESIAQERDLASQGKWNPPRVPEDQGGSLQPDVPSHAPGAPGLAPLRGPGHRPASWASECRWAAGESCAMKLLNLSRRGAFGRSFHIDKLRSGPDRGRLAGPARADPAGHTGLLWSGPKSRTECKWPVAASRSRPASVAFH